jgi:YHS domain-containing protein
MELAPGHQHPRRRIRSRIRSEKVARKKSKPINFYVLVPGMALILGLAVATLVHHPGDGEAGPGAITDRSRICMLQDTVQARSGLIYVHNGKKYYLCCGGCLAAFQRDAAAHSHAIDPVSGNMVDKADAPAYAYHGHAYFFSTATNMTKFAADPEKFLANTQSAER